MTITKKFPSQQSFFVFHHCASMPLCSRYAFERDDWGWFEIHFNISWSNCSYILRDVSCAQNKRHDAYPTFDWTIFISKKKKITRKIQTKKQKVIYDYIFFQAEFRKLSSWSKMLSRFGITLSKKRNKFILFRCYASTSDSFVSLPCS